jgi:Ulp1 family protease
MKNQQKPANTKLSTRFDKELMTILMSDLKAIRNKQFLNAIQLNAA